ncbi:hypothetical protein [Shewanella sp. Actino-trap-3]|uniref:hypothetical protein n=1 Tax=Shewanella sp. Actino-trap-3 TaxID=2058331 RepID=UPI0012FF5203|nr:hypothetical protein [Shewanella sp. Actino-trap-3]
MFSQRFSEEFKSLTIEHLMTHRSGLPNYPKNVTRIDGDAFLGGYDENAIECAKTIKLSFTVNENGNIQI